MLTGTPEGWKGWGGRPGAPGLRDGLGEGTRAEVKAKAKARSQNTEGLVEKRESIGLARAEHLGCVVGMGSHGKVVGKEGHGLTGSPLFHGHTSLHPTDYQLIQGGDPAYNWV